MATAKQSEVKWVPKDKKTGKGGFLALRSNPSKPFSGTVTGIKKGTTTASGGKAVYSGGRNVAATAKRSQKSSGSSAAAGITAKTSKNIGYTAGGVSSKKPAAVQNVSAQRKAGAKRDALARRDSYNIKKADGPGFTSNLRKIADTVGDAVSNWQNRETTADRQLRSLKNNLMAKKRSLKSAAALRTATAAEKNRQTKLQQEIAALQKQINSLK